MERLNWNEFTETKYNEMVEAIHSRTEDKFEYFALQFADDIMNNYQVEINPVALGNMREWALDIAVFDKEKEDYDGSLATGFYEEDIPSYIDFKDAAEGVAHECIGKYADKAIETSKESEHIKFNYRLLSRLQQDCIYVLDTCVAENGSSLEGAQKHLWAKNPKEQIEKMQELYDSLPVKPEWLTQDDINNYAARFEALSGTAQTIDLDKLASDVEQYIFERGEYDYGYSDRMVLLKDAPEPYELADMSPSDLRDVRDKITSDIKEELVSGTDIKGIIEYFRNDWRDLADDDELIPKNEALTDKLCDLQEQYKVYTVSAYYDGDYRGLAASENFNDWSKVEEFAHEQLMKGSFVRIDNNKEGGKRVEISPDEYQEGFNGEFIYKADDLETPSIKPFMDVIRDMDAGEHFTIESPVEGAVMVITKDPDFIKNRVVMETVLSDVTNKVTVDFQVNNKSVATTAKIDVDNLESSINKIANGDTSLLANTNKSLKELVTEANSPKANKEVDR